MADEPDEIEYLVSLTPDGVTSWVGSIEFPAWRLTVHMYAFVADGENEARWAIHRTVERNLRYFQQLGAGTLSLVVPSRPVFTPAAPGSPDIGAAGAADTFNPN